MGKDENGLRLCKKPPCGQWQRGKKEGFFLPNQKFPGHIQRGAWVGLAPVKWKEYGGLKPGPHGRFYMPDNPKHKLLPPTSRLYSTLSSLVCGPRKCGKKITGIQHEILSDF